MKTEDITFSTEDLLFLKDVKKSGKISSNLAVRVEEIFRKIDPNYNLCKSCMPTLAGETNRIINMAERFIGMKLEVYTGIKYTEDTLKAMTADNIIVLVKEETGIDMDVPKKNKKKVIAQALIELNK